VQSRESYIMYKSFVDALEMLPEENYGKAMRAINRYAIYDEMPGELPADAQIVFTMARPQIDANIERRENGKKGAEYGKKGGRPKKENPIGVIDENPIGVNSKTPNVNVNVNENVNVNDNENVNVKVNDNISPLNPPKGIDAMIDEADLNDSVKEGIKTWVRYKKEQFRFTYKPTGFKALLSEIKGKEVTLGDNGILEAINKSMSKGYKGIIWDLVNTSTGSPYMQAIKDRVNVVDSWR